MVSQTFLEDLIREKLIALSAAKKKLEKAYTSSLTAHLKALKQKEANSPKRSMVDRHWLQPSAHGADAQRTYNLTRLAKRSLCPGQCHPIH